MRVSQVSSLLLCTSSISFASPLAEALTLEKRQEPNQGEPVEGNLGAPFSGWCSLYRANSKSFFELTH